MSKQQVITWQSPNGGKIRVTPKQEALANKANVWPKDDSGNEYCSVSYGLHHDTPTYTDEEWQALIQSLGGK